MSDAVQAEPAAELEPIVVETVVETTEQSAEQQPAVEPAKDTKAIIDGFWVCKLGEGNPKKVCKAESWEKAIEYFAAVVRCNPAEVTCDPATSLPVDGYGCGLSKECWDMNKSAVIIEAAFDKLL
jgi:hypothetical protein